MSDLTCPECGEALEVDQDWQITDESLLGKEIKGGESIQGDYAHKECLE